MAKKKSVGDDDFSFFNTIPTHDRYADANVQHPDYGYLDTGSYAFNALLSGDLFGGYPKNEFIMVAGKKGTGKSVLGKNTFARPLMDEGYFIFHYDTENEATTEKKLVEENGYKPNQFKLIKECTTVEDLFISINGILNKLEEDKGDKLENKRKCAIVIDSQGQLSTTKTINDATKEKLTADQTKAKLLKGMYNSIVNRCGNLGVPVYVTNHVYDKIGVFYGNPETVSGGEGGQYSASIILSLYKSFEKEKEGTITGVVFKATVLKSRHVKDKLQVPIYLDYKYGLDRYYGLHEFALHAGLIEEFTRTKFPQLSPPLEADGKVTRKKCYVIKDPNKNPDEWIVCKESQLRRKDTIGTILEPINQWVKDNFVYAAPTLWTGEYVAPEDDIDNDEVEASEKARRKADAEELAMKNAD